MVCCGCTWTRTRLHCMALLSWLALAFAIVAAYDCRFVEVVTLDEGNSYLLGIFRFSYRHDVCVSYNEIDGVETRLSTASKSAQAFGTLAVIFGGVAVIFLLVMQCWVLKPVMWRVLCLLCFFAMVSQSLTFLVFKATNDSWCYRSDIECNLGIDGIISICACCFWFLLALLACVLKPPESSAYQCVFMKKVLAKIVGVTGIEAKQDIKRSIRSTSWVQVLVLLISLACVAFSGSIAFGCRYFKTKFEGRTFKYGLHGYYYPPDGSCRNYEYGDRVSFTASTKAAQVFGYITFAMSLIILLLLFGLLFLNYPALLRRSIPVLAFFAFMFQSFTMFGYIEYNDLVCTQPDQDCEVGEDFIFTCVAMGLYLIITLMIAFCAGAIPNQEAEMGYPEEGGDKGFEDEDESLKEEAAEEPVDEEPAPEEPDEVGDDGMPEE